jgi:hypothetical protein
MIETELVEIVEQVLIPLGASAELGEEFQTPALDVLHYYRRPVRLSRVPLLGRAWSVVALVRQPIDIGIKVGGGYKALLHRVAGAANARFPPGRDGRWGTIGLTTVVLTPEPIAVDDDTTIQSDLARPTRSRVLPLALFRLNLGQGAMAMALTRTPPGLFPESEALADALVKRFRRFVPLLPA